MLVQTYLKKIPAADLQNTQGFDDWQRHICISSHNDLQFNGEQRSDTENVTSMHVDSVNVDNSGLP